MVGLPAGIRACLFDLDGVLTPTAVVHAAARKPAPDSHLHAARLLGVDAASAAVFEDDQEVRR